jgi:hypothetical protein
MLVIAAVTVVFPILLQGYEMHGLGDVWQGRYILPLTVGMLFLAGFAETPLPLDAPTVRWLMILTAAGELTCLWWAVRHNANVHDLAGPLLPRHPAWDPPVTWPGALAAFLGGLALILWPLRRITSRADGLSSAAAV